MTQVENVNFIEKYSPRKLSEFIGNVKPVQQIIDWLTVRDASTTKGLAIIGDSGTGKTTIVQLLAKEFAEKFNFVWLASDELNVANSNTATSLAKYKSNDLLRFLGMNQQKFLVADDAYTLKSSKQIKDLIKATSDSVPIIFITDNPKVVKRVRNLTCITLKMLPMKLILPYFTSVTSKEKIKMNQKELSGIIKGNEYDFRSIFQYLDLYFRSGTKPNPKQPTKGAKGGLTPIESFKDNQTNDQDLANALMSRKFKVTEENLYQIYHEGITNLIHKAYTSASKDLDVLSKCADLFSYSEAYLHENTFNVNCNHYYHHIIHLGIPFELTQTLNLVPSSIG